MTEPLPQGSVIGILGGGQLGRMLAVAASRLGFKTCIFEPGGDCPASHVANFHFQFVLVGVRVEPRRGTSGVLSLWYVLVAGFVLLVGVVLCVGYICIHRLASTPTGTLRLPPSLRSFKRKH